MSYNSHVKQVFLRQALRLTPLSASLGLLTASLPGLMTKLRLLMLSSTYSNNNTPTQLPHASGLALCLGWQMARQAQPPDPPKGAVYAPLS